MCSYSAFVCFVYDVNRILSLMRQKYTLVEALVIDVYKQHIHTSIRSNFHYIMLSRALSGYATSDYTP